MAEAKRKTNEALEAMQSALTGRTSDIANEEQAPPSESAKRSAMGKIADLLMAKASPSSNSSGNYRNAGGSQISYVGYQNTKKRTFG